MADVKISQLQPLAGAGAASGDLLAIVDISAGVTKNISVDALALALSALLENVEVSGTFEHGGASVPASHSAIIRGGTNKNVAFGTDGTNLWLSFINDANSANVPMWLRASQCYYGAGGSSAHQFLGTGGVQIQSGSPILKMISATAALDFGSIAAGSQADLTVTVSSAAVGDAVSVGLPAGLPAGIVINAFVSAVDTVTVRASNITGSSINPASATYRVVVTGF